ncbi:MAG: glycosyltransferase [bacterium]
MKCLLLTTYPYEEPCARVRFLLLKNELNKHDVNLIHHSIFSKWLFTNKNVKGKRIRKTIYLLWGLKLRLLTILFVAPFVKVVIIQKEGFPIGKDWIEKFIKLVNKNVVLDFDDAVYTFPEHLKDWRPLKGEDKLGNLIEMSKLTLVGSKHLKNYADKYSKNTCLYFDSVNVDEYPTKYHEQKNQYVIGWIGSEPGLKYLEIIKPALDELSKEIKFTFHIIGPKSTPQDILGNVKTKIIPWSKENEIEELLKFDIGVMPLHDNEWERGKSGFKLVQYMAAGVPFVASPVGMNIDFARNDTGILADKKEEWVQAFKKLLESKNLRNEIGKKGREYAMQNNDIKANAKYLAYLLKNLNNPKLTADLTRIKHYSIM